MNDSLVPYFCGPLCLATERLKVLFAVTGSDGQQHCRTVIVFKCLNMKMFTLSTTTGLLTDGKNDLMGLSDACIRCSEKCRFFANLVRAVI